MKKLFLAMLLVSLSVCAFAQQSYVGRYDMYAGFSYLDTPELNLMERGFITQEGININKWLAFGIDYSVMDGHSTIFPSEIKQSVLTGKLLPLLGSLPPGAIPPGYSLFVPYNSTTSTFTAGPQLNYRHFKKVTLFIHPDIGAIHETVTPRPKDPIQTGVVRVLAPAGKISDLTYFYGVGGGTQYHVTKHIGVRFTFDFVHVYLFSDLLKNSRNAYRFGIGPYFNLGENVAKK